ncbi:MAG: arylsulfatase [Candidatus Latescibacteria bacterium]|nr:arylsulfatase [Candidatus Latescibacterota bacterium]
MSHQPHILLILTDHWRGDCLSRLGHPVAETPHLDSLSRQGTTFTRAYTPCPSCIAARRSLMTGMTPSSQGMVGYKDGVPWDYPHTMAGELQRAGYQTVNIGKTHFHPDRLHLGFEQLVLSQDYSDWLGGRPDVTVEKFAHGVPANSWMARPNHQPEQLLEETYFVSRSFEFLGKRDPTRPFFLCLSFNGPHPPWCPPQVFYDQFIDRPMPQPTVGEWAQVHADQAQYPLDINDWRGQLPPHLNQRARAAYFAYLAFLDAQIGRLSEYLHRSGLLQDTLLVFSSDHGEMLGDHNLWRKTYAYEASARVPLIVRPPAAWQGGRNRTLPQVVGWEDIMPTLLEAGQAPIPPTVEGRSLIPLLSDQATDWRPYYHGEHSPCYDRENAHQFLTDGHWKYIWNPITGAEQFFNLDQDPMECNDLSASANFCAPLESWRQRMVEELAGRPEGLSDGRKLCPGPVPVWRGDDPNDVHLG